MVTWFWSTSSPARHLVHTKRRRRPAGFQCFQCPDRKDLQRCQIQTQNQGIGCPSHQSTAQNGCCCWAPKPRRFTERKVKLCASKSTPLIPCGAAFVGESNIIAFDPNLQPNAVFPGVHVVRLVVAIGCTTIKPVLSLLC